MVWAWLGPPHSTTASTNIESAMNLEVRVTIEVIFASTNHQVKGFECRPIG
jgi:hypothetical protein